jgi:hypothetical protein
MEENVRLRLNLISNGAWRKHCMELWNTESTNEGNTGEAKDKETDNNTEKINQELETVIRKAKNRKRAELDNIPRKLFKYGGNKLKEILLALFNNIWNSKQIPKDWEKVW